MVTLGLVVLIPIVPRADSGWYLVGAPADLGVGPRTAGLAGLAGLLNSFRMVRAHDPTPSGAVEGAALA